MRAASFSRYLTITLVALLVSGLGAGGGAPARRANAASRATIVAPMTPTVRYNINVNRLAPGFAPIHGAILDSASGQGFIAEQTVFAPNYSTLHGTQGLAR